MRRAGGQEATRIFEDKVAEIVFDERVGGRVERSEEGEEAEWADVLALEPHERFLVRWRVNPERGPTEAEIRFTPEVPENSADLEHRGLDDPEGRANYGPGWDFVLGKYVAAFG